MLKWLTLVDEFTPECLALAAARSMPARKAGAVLADVVGGALGNQGDNPR